MTNKEIGEQEIKEMKVFYEMYCKHCHKNVWSKCYKTCKNRDFEEKEFYTEYCKSCFCNCKTCTRKNRGK